MREGEGWRKSGEESEGGWEGEGGRMGRGGSEMVLRYWRNGGLFSVLDHMFSRHIKLINNLFVCLFVCLLLLLLLFISSLFCG